MRCRCVIWAVLATAIGATSAPAGSFDLSWHTIDGGGAMFSSGGGFELGGTIGQPDAVIMTGGNFELAGAFWAGAVPQSACLGDMNDADGDGTPDCLDGCPGDANKLDPGTCGCGTADTDTDGDGVPDCLDGCPTDPNKLEPGICGCGLIDDITDSDGDGVPDCADGCPDDPNKIDPGPCGCGTSDEDANGNGMPDCLESPVAVDPVLPPAGQPADGCAPLCGMGIGGPVPLMMFGLWGTKLCLRRRRRRGREHGCCPSSVH